MPWKRAEAVRADRRQPGVHAPRALAGLGEELERHLLEGLQPGVHPSDEEVQDVDPGGLSALRPGLARERRPEVKQRLDALRHPGRVPGDLLHRVRIDMLEADARQAVADRDVRPAKRLAGVERVRAKADLGRPGATVDPDGGDLPGRVEGASRPPISQLGYQRYSRLRRLRRIGGTDAVRAESRVRHGAQHSGDGLQRVTGDVAQAGQLVDRSPSSGSSTSNSSVASRSARSSGTAIAPCRCRRTRRSTSASTSRLARRVASSPSGIVSTRSMTSSRSNQNSSSSAADVSPRSSCSTSSSRVNCSRRRSIVNPPARSANDPSCSITAAATSAGSSWSNIAGSRSASAANGRTRSCRRAMARCRPLPARSSSRAASASAAASRSWTIVPPPARRRSRARSLRAGRRSARPRRPPPPIAAGARVAAGCARASRSRS